MLVLSRKKTERLVIGDSIILVVVEIRGESVRLGIDAPYGVDIDREEVWLAKQQPFTSTEQPETGNESTSPSASVSAVDDFPSDPGDGPGRSQAAPS